MLEGIVTCVKHAATLSENVYYITSLDGGEVKVSELKSNIVLHLGDMINAEPNGGRIESAIISDSKDSLPLYSSKALEYSRKLAVNSDPSAVLALDKVTHAMRPKLQSAAALLIEGLLTGSPLIVRFHNDADGATGGYGLYLALQDLFKRIAPSGSPKVFWKMQRGIAYTVSDAREDTITVGNYNSLGKPVLLITDFGTTEESLEGAKIASEKFEIIWLDHHPVAQSLADLINNYINPWQFGGDSNYTAGFLTCEFGKLFAKIDVGLIQSAAMVGDYSSYALGDQEGKDFALLLDMLTSDKKIAISSGATDLTPLEIDQIMNDEKKKTELVNYAKTRIEDAIDSGIEALKQYKTDYASVYLLDFENVRRDYNTKYPLPGRYASKLLERIEKGSEKPPILVLHFGHFVSIRVSSPIADRVNLLTIVNELKASYSYIDAAGGHKNAASIKLKTDEAKKELIYALLRALGCSIA
ncbi:MAG: hypothetical protein KGH71_00780 [Candidatus Micrarchaeota archaeon]|nr:hypothetical protein [Candidatus Micrarchaeota archaeon]